MVELVVAENCFHVLRVKLVERPSIEVVECDEVQLQQIPNNPPVVAVNGLCMEHQKQSQ